MNRAAIQWISGPVLKARVNGPFRVNEAVLVGDRGLLGEVVRLDGEEITVQVYEDTTGLRPGDKVVGEGRPLAIRLGPGLLGGIYDGLLRPLTISKDDFIQPGMAREFSRTFQFQPSVAVGDPLTGGAILGQATLDGVIHHPIPLSPSLQGEVVTIVPAGSYQDDETILQLKTPAGQVVEVAMSHWWPVRTPRPVRERLAIGPPLLTGQRVLDCLFPVARGGKAMVPGGFGTGKTVLLETVAKWCNADVIIYVGCGERGNELSGVLEEFPQLEDPRSGRPLMERTLVIANTSNMPVAAREASIYTGVTVAEYFRDLGLNVALMADSTSRWAEALREVSGRLGELPGEGGYPAYLSTRLAAFYERAARVRTLTGEGGSLTLIGAVSPPSSDFSEPVTIHTKRYVRNLWELDRKRAQARFYPAIEPLHSYSEDAVELATWWQKQGNPRWAEQRRKFLTLLEEQSRLERMARILGKDTLPPRQQLTLLCASLVNEGFLRQSAFAAKDRFCSPQKQNRMMVLLERFLLLADKAVEAGVTVEAISEIPVLRRLQRMGEEIGDDEMERFNDLEKELERAFAGLSSERGTP
ncbi:MAG: V-type ATP synthase subunit A [Magnetococcales bacterium]|nr:V-type ATP synthase subunit A [Magnetococcales bacterium]NGZ27571.1 V-type ATP synthase subunit A [Magnetococcales bacterium]